MPIYADRGAVGGSRERHAGKRTGVTNESSSSTLETGMGLSWKGYVRKSCTVLTLKPAGMYVGEGC